MRLIVTLLLLLAASAFGQNAVVIPTVEADAANLRRLNKELQSAQKALDAAKREIEERYLLTEDVDLSSGHQAHRKGEDRSGLHIGIGVSSIATWNSYCPTPAERDKQKAEQAKYEAEQAAYEKAHPWLYWRKGFDGSGSYEFSEDYRFIVPKPPAPPSESFWIKPAATWQWSPNNNGLMYK